MCPRDIILLQQGNIQGSNFKYFCITNKKTSYGVKPLTLLMPRRGDGRAGGGGGGGVEPIPQSVSSITSDRHKF